MWWNDLVITITVSVNLFQITKFMEDKLTNTRSNLVEAQPEKSHIEPGGLDNPKDLDDIEPTSIQPGQIDNGKDEGLPIE